MVANLGLIFTNRSWTQTALKTLRQPNGALWWVVGGALVFMSTILYLPLLRELFKFSTLSLLDLGLCLAGGTLSIIWFELFKRIRNSPAVGTRQIRRGRIGRS
jgi:Ca2+-transporting ATPase